MRRKRIDWEQRRWQVILAIVSGRASTDRSLGATQTIIYYADQIVDAVKENEEDEESKYKI